MEEIADAIERLTRAVEAPNSTFEVLTGVVIPLGVSVLSSLLVVFVLWFQHRARRRELDQEAKIRAEDRRQAAIASRKAAKRRAAGALMTGLNTAHVLRALKQNPAQVETAQLQVAEAFRGVQDAALLDLEDDDLGLLKYTIRRMLETLKSTDGDEASEIAADAATQIRRWLREEVTASELFEQVSHQAAS